HAETPGGLIELALAVVQVEQIRSPICDEKILVAVVVDVPHARPVAPSGVGQAGSLGHISESSLPGVAIEPVGGHRRLSEAFQSRRIDDEEVDPAIAVEIESGETRAISLNNVF